MGWNHQLVMKGAISGEVAISPVFCVPNGEGIMPLKLRYWTNFTQHGGVGIFLDNLFGCLGGFWVLFGFLFDRWKAESA